MAHTNDIGLAIAELLEQENAPDDLIFQTWDWSKDDPEPSGTDYVLCVDSSDGFSNLIVDTLSGESFRVTVTRIG